MENNDGNFCHSKKLKRLEIKKSYHFHSRVREVSFRELPST